MKQKVIKQVTVDNTVYDVVICEECPTLPVCFYCALNFIRCVQRWDKYEYYPCVTGLSEDDSYKTFLVEKEAGQ